jgi:hypothetical protein
MAGITKQRNFNLAQATVSSRDVLPVPQRVLGIDGDEDDFTVAVPELFETVLEREHFGWAHKREG